MAGLIFMFFLLPVLTIMSARNPIRIKVMGYNPMSMAAEERAIDICEEASNFDFVLLSGVCIPSPPGGQAKTFVHNNMTIYTGGWVRSAMSNTVDAL